MENPEEPRVHAFGDFELDERLYELRRGGAVVKVEPKVFDVLAYLVRHRDRVVAKDELLGQLWPGEFVSESVLPRCITAARKALGDDPADARLIQTVHGRGYRFIAPLRAAGAAASDDRDGVPAAALAEPAAGVFVGRDDAMAQLRAAFERAWGGSGQLVLVLGEPGIGKTRTAEEVAALARARGARVLAGGCYEGEGAPAFWPWVQILRALGGAGASARSPAELGPDAVDLAALVPDLEAPAAGRAAPPLVVPEQARFRLFDGVAGFLRRASTARPLVLLLDDLHWADKPSLLLLQFLAREIRRAAILILGTYRDVALGRHHPLAETLGELAREPACQRVALRGLAEADVLRFIELTAERAPAPGVAAAVHAMTEGNPFFIGEIVRLLVAEGRLERPPDGTTLAVALPQGVREAIGRRLSALSEPCNRALALASVIGREFHLHVLQRVAELPAESLLALLDEAAGARILVPDPGAPGRYAFAHALVRETLYEELTLPVRVRLHRRVGEVLEEVHGADVTAHLPELAYHFFQAAPGGEAARAVAYARRAAERALELLAYEEAAGHYQRALEATDFATPPDEAARCALLLGLGDAQSRSGERTAARCTFERAAAIARRLGRPDDLARAALGFGGRAEFGVGPDEAVRALVEEALAALGEDDHALRARLLSRMTGTEPYSISMETRRRLSAEAVALARRAGDRATLVAALSARFWALLGPDHLDERFAVGEELLALATKSGDRNCAFLAHEVRLGVSLVRGDIPAADREIEIMGALAAELRQPVELWFVTWSRASRAVADGRFAEAERLMNEGLAIGERAQHPAAPQAFAGQMLWLRGEQGLLEHAEQVEAAFRSLIERRPASHAILQAGVANLHSDLGRLAEARQELDALATHGFADIERDEHWLVTMHLLAEVCADVGDAPRAALLYDLLRPFADLNVVHDLIRAYRGSASLALGMLARTMGRFPEAIGHLESALVMNRRLGTRPYVVRAQCEYVRVLLDRGSRADLPKARQLLAAARVAAEEMGMKRGVAVATALAARLDEGAAKKAPRAGRRR
jgi:DNA-binding winged helix-turn-helix (wHTH) protein/tetratricopeptide (TPR) repeat protein